MYPYILQSDNIVVVIDGQPHSLARGSIGFESLRDAIKNGDWHLVPDLVSPKEAIKRYSNGMVEVVNGQVLYNGKPIHGVLVNKIVQMFEEGFDITPMVNFLKNLMLNPSKRAVDELYGFLEAGNMAITPDGCFLAYKKVRDDYRDCHSGKFDNSVGQVLSMPRNEVDDDKDRTCSYGFHFCSHSYLKHFGGSRVMVLKINPMDVASIPSDYNLAKGRTCRYEVVGELNKEEVDANILQNKAVINTYDKDDGKYAEDSDETYVRSKVEEFAKSGVLYAFAVFAYESWFDVDIRNHCRDSNDLVDQIYFNSGADWSEMRDLVDDFIAEEL